MIYCIDPNITEPIMHIDTYIGMDENGVVGIDGATFAKELLMLDEMGKSRIQVWINSPGGVITDGMAIYNAILKTKTKVDTYCITAFSIAAVIFQAGRRRIMVDYGMQMFHNPSGGDKKSLAKFKESILTMVCKRSGKDAAEVSKMMDRETWLTALECEQLGLCDEIELSEAQNKPRFSNTIDASILWQESRNYFNKIINKQPNQMNKLFCAYLGISENATAEEITNALNKKQAAEAENASKAAAEKKEIEIELDALKKKMAAFETEDPSKKEAEQLKSMQDKCNKLETELKTIKERMAAEDAKNAEDAATRKAEADAKNKAEAEAFLSSAPVVNKIGDKAVATWVEKYIADPEGTKEIIDAMPINVKGVNAMESAKDAAGKVEYPTNAASELAKIKAATEAKFNK